MRAGPSGYGLLPTRRGPLPPHRGLPADVVHGHGHVLYHVETLASHRDGPAATVGDGKPRQPNCSPRERAQPGGPGLGSHLTGLRRGLMAVMTGFCMYWKVRLLCTQPRRSKRTHTGTGAGRAPSGIVQAMLVSVRLRKGRGIVSAAPSPGRSHLPHRPGRKPVHLAWVPGLLSARPSPLPAPSHIIQEAFPELLSQWPPLLRSGSETALTFSPISDVSISYGSVCFPLRAETALGSS